MYRFIISLTLLHVSISSEVKFKSNYPYNGLINYGGQYGQLPTYGGVQAPYAYPATNYPAQIQSPTYGGVGGLTSVSNNGYYGYPYYPRQQIVGTPYGYTQPCGGGGYNPYYFLSTGSYYGGPCSSSGIQTGGITQVLPSSIGGVTQILPNSIGGVTHISPSGIDGGYIDSQATGNVDPFAGVPVDYIDVDLTQKHNGYPVVDLENTGFPYFSDNQYAGVPVETIDVGGTSTHTGGSGGASTHSGGLDDAATHTGGVGQGKHEVNVRSHSEQLSSAPIFRSSSIATSKPIHTTITRTFGLGDDDHSDVNLLFVNGEPVTETQAGEEDEASTNRTEAEEKDDKKEEDENAITTNNDADDESDPPSVNSWL